MRSLLVAILGLAALVAPVGCGGTSAGAPPEEEILPLPGDQPAFPFPEHTDQFLITTGAIRFPELFDIGDELFEVAFNGLDGVGVAELPDGAPHPTRFARIPPGGGRNSGPNGQACVGCHNFPQPTSAGEAASIVLQDPAGLGEPPFNVRSVPTLFGSAVLQRLAEEMTEELHAARDDALATGLPVSRELVAKGISFGVLRVTLDRGGNPVVDTTGVRGVGPDLVIRPYGWKGNVTTLRDFTRDAAFGELGMLAEELAWKDPLGRTDPDGDGVERELSVGDVTAIAVYIGAQEIPQGKRRLVRDGLLPPPPRGIGRRIREGEALFSSIGCAECHVPELRLDDPRFEEPTRRGRGHFFDREIDPGATFLDPDAPFVFDLVREGDFPRLEPRGDGAVVRLFGDLRRHRMGRALADPRPTAVRNASGRPAEHEGVPLVVARDTFLTAELWGVGDSGPWLHDGRAGTLDEAIRLHGEDAPPPPGDPDRSGAQEARDAYLALPEDDRISVVEFLKSLVHFALPEDEE